ncbi:MAG: flagellar filament capping protein FliD [Polaromonas sp.]
MATTAVSSASAARTAAIDAQAANKANAQKIITAMNAGSGVDIAALAQGLVDAERAPQENLINRNIAKSEAQVSGYAAISFMLKAMNDSLTALKDANSFNASSVSNSNAAALGVTASAGAAAGSYSVQVNSLALPQRSMSIGFASASTQLNSGDAFNLSLSINGAAATNISIGAGSDTPEGMVSAINSALLGVTAKLVNTGEASNPFKIILTGATGAAQAFMVANPTTTSPVSFSQSQAAANASISFGGVDYTRTSNTVTDIIPGLTLDLKTTTTTAVGVSLTRDTAAVKTKINALVTAYNDVNNILNEVSNSKSTLDTYGATLVGNSVVRQVRFQLREMLLGESSSPGTSVGALWQMGLSVDRTGVMTVDATKLDTALTTNFDDVVKTFTGNQNNRSATSPPYGTTAGFSSSTATLNAGEAFSLSLVNSSGTFSVPVPVGSTTPQGVVDAINASNQGFTAQLVQDSTSATPYKIMIMGGTGSSGFTLTAKDSTGTAVADFSFSANGSGIAGDAFRKISALLAADGPMLTQSANATTQADKLKATLEVLQTRMKALLDRYTQQFAAMESLVGSINSQKAGLKTSFDGMMSIYTNNN